MNELRSNPDQILKSITENENKSQRGHLHIFFGYAAGVGKTYSMLKAAHKMLTRGFDTVIGYVEPHMRPATSALIDGIEVIPPKIYRNGSINVQEFDIDAALKRNPEIIIIDELAHTNAVGCRHEKRYQDIEEVLAAGINVFTTVNVQHIESLNDIVASITGVIVRERIPDHVFDAADLVKLVDIEPEELIERMKEGKVYSKTQAKLACNNFFTVENLTALREIALRRCADRVNLLSASARIKSGNEYYTDEHILVCLSSSPTNQKIIRNAARMAKAFKGSFTALFVETPNYSLMSEENKKRLRENTHVAEQLGANVETTYGNDVALQIAEFARISGVSKIVVGRSSISQKALIKKQTITEKLINYAPNLDIYVIPDQSTERFKEQKKYQKDSSKILISDVIKSIGILIIATLIGFLFYELGFSEANIITIYILGVLITAVVTTRRMYSLISSLLSVLVFNFFFTIPRFTLTAYDAGYPATFMIMFLSAFITSTLAVKIKQHAKLSASTAYRTKILLDTNQMLSQKKDKKEIIDVMANQISKLLHRNVIFYIPNKDGTLEKFPYSIENEEIDQIYLTENEEAVAYWVFKNNKHAGATTQTLSSAKCLYLAIRVKDHVYGVIGIVIDGTALDAFENSILLSILGEGALALENVYTAIEKQEAAVLAKNEQLRANLLRSISHDLRTPLTSISGNASILLSSSKEMSVEKKDSLYSDIYDDSLWLINLVENLLSVTKIEDGSMHLKMTTEILDEVVDEALSHVKPKKEEHTINLNRKDDFILVNIDARLMMQVVINIVDNAMKYTPAGSIINIITYKVKEKAYLIIEDNGPGISDKAKAHIFDMFYTAENVVDSRRSLGLGLALCKSIVTAHNGTIEVQDNDPVGARFVITLPVEEVKLHE